MRIYNRLVSVFDRFINKSGMRMKAKLVILFVFITIIPLLLLAFVSLHQFYFLGKEFGMSISNMKSDTINVLPTMIATAAALIVLMTLTAVFIASAFSNRIINLIKGISRFSTGERNFRFNMQPNDEMGMLATSFDELADSLTEADRGPLVITDMKLNALFVNELLLIILDMKLEDVLGVNYHNFSLYPSNSVYDPIRALKEGREAEIYYDERLTCYLKGEASYLTDRNRKQIGYIITSTDVTDLMEQQGELEKAVAEAKLANEHKSFFLARMSHEIRTPMNAIIGMTEIVKKKLKSNSYMLDDVLTNVSQIEVSSHHLLGLLNDILDLSKFEADKVELVMEEMDLGKIAQTVVTIIQPRCDEKRIMFETHFEFPEDIFYLGDSLRIRQVLINLLGNAVKFTSENGKIVCNIIYKEHKDGKALIDFSVQDTGIGISSEALSMLFKPFQQANNKIANDFGGTGLGLAISKSIVKMFGGDITVTSAERKGSVFHFSLWLEEIIKTHTKQDAIENFMENMTDRLKGKKALLVDDVEINRIIAISMFDSSGLEIDEANDGTEAVKIFGKSDEYEYDIIFMDVQMPEMNGYDATIAIRAMDRNDAKTIPIVALTANAFKEDIDKAMESGMNAYLAKPMDMEKTLEITCRQLLV